MHFIPLTFYADFDLAVCEVEPRSQEILLFVQPPPSSEEFELTATVVSKIIGLPDFSPLDSMVNKSCNIERCVNKVHQIVTNMMLSKYLGLILNLL